MLFGTPEPPPTLEMEAVGAERPRDEPDAKVAGTRSKARPAHYAEDPSLPAAARRFASSTATILGMLIVILAAATGLASVLLPDDHGTEAAADDTGTDLPTTTERDMSGPSTTSASSSTTTTETTGSTTTTTLLAVVDPDLTTTTTTTRPTTTTTTQPTTTTAPPDPVINSFGANIYDSGCGRGATPADISWSTSHATSVAVGPPGGQSGVAASGQLTDCIDDSGETWRLTASGPGGTTSQDIFVNP
jgi:cytoskeletal protein RodZ